VKEIPTWRLENGYCVRAGLAAERREEVKLGEMTRTIEDLIPDYLRGLPVYVPGKPIEEVERELKIHAVKLASNENRWGLRRWRWKRPEKP